MGEPRPFAVMPRQLQAVHELDRAERPAEDMGMHGDVEAAARQTKSRPVADVRSKVRVNASGSAP